MNRRIHSLIVSVGLVLSACGLAQNNTIVPATSTTAFTVAPRFAAVYTDHGGHEVLRDPISPEIQDGAIIYQYFQNGRLEYNPAAPAGGEFSLSPLTLEFYPVDPPAAGPPPADALCYPQTGHCVNYAFRDYYEAYGGVYFFGFPISEMKTEDNRLVQYFERAVFVWDESLPPRLRVRLAELGYLKCSQVNCAAPGSARPSTSAAGATVTPTPINAPIAAYVARHGGTPVFGVALADPQTGPDGRLEQYYENVVLFVDPTAPEGIRLRPLGLGHHPQDPAAAPVPDPNGLYDPVTGHNVLYAFRDYYDRNGGYLVFGHPISEMKIEGGLLVQHFESGRMELRSGAPPDMRVRLTAYGREAWEGQPQPTPAPPAQMPQSLQLQAWPDAPVLSTGEAQTLNVFVADGQGRALAGVSVQIVVQATGGAQTFNLPLTDNGGHTSVTFVLPAWHAGEFVTYEVAARYGDLSAGPLKDQFIQWYGAEPTTTPPPN